jgi:hypothetical protein
MENDDSRFAIGPIYKYEKDNFIIIGRAMIGGKQLLMCDISSAELKEKGTNERININ